MSDIRDAVTARPLVLDGGLGTMLEARGHDLSSDLWSARVLVDAPDDVRAVHRDFVAAGADVITSGSYQIGYENLGAAGVAPDDVDRLLAESVALARQAATESERRVFVAASVGPYGATRADGSEYTGAYDRSVAELATWHRRRLEALVAAEPDLVAVETIASPAEAEAVARAVEGIGIPSWISLSGSSAAFDRASLRATLVAAAGVPGVIAVGVNCCPPERVAPALADAAGVPFIVYPNSGETWDAASRRWRGARGLPLADIDAWLARGARIIGGCCRTTPVDIAGVAARLRAERRTAPRLR